MVPLQQCEVADNRGAKHAPPSPLAQEVSKALMLAYPPPSLMTAVSGVACGGEAEEAGMVLVAWRFLLNCKVQIETKNKHQPYVTKVLLCVLVASLINLIKTILGKSLPISFHVNAYFDTNPRSIVPSPN
ncbi:hypothetical protein ACLOJK_027742 [Asimina triloba]